MTKIYSPKHPLYFSVAKQFCNYAEELEKDIQEFAKDQPNLGIDIIPKRNQLLAYATISVVFSALTIEAFINWYLESRYCSDSRGDKKKAYRVWMQECKDRKEEMKNDAKKNFNLIGEDFSETVLKWIYAPKIVLQKSTLVTSEPLIKKLHQLFKERNRIAHPKVVKKEVEDEQTGLNLLINTLMNIGLEGSEFSEEKDLENTLFCITAADTRNGVETVTEAVIAFRELDPNIGDIYWLSNSLFA
jgi:hypothetical protein